MGIEDRDYYREQYRRNAAPLGADARRFPPRRTTRFRIVLVWLLVGLAAFPAIERWASLRGEAGQAPSRRAVPGTTPRAAESIRPTAQTPASMAGRVSAPPLDDASPARAAPSIYRCGNAYGIAPCPNGRAVEGPAASGFDSRPSPKLAALVAAGRTNEETTTFVDGSTTTAVTRSSSGSECAFLAGRLLGIDADARQPHPPAYLDWLRTQRQLLRDRQASLHC